MNKCMITENSKFKFLRSDVFNYNLDKRTGYMETWGRIKEEDPQFCPFGPVIADIEVTTICSGVNGTPCSFCYKSNTNVGKNMSFETFKTIFDKLPKTLTQIAFGADATLTSNPDLFKMMKYSKDNGVMPNITVANVNDETASKLKELCGVVCVSNYGPQWCYESVKRLISKGVKTNIHQLLSKQTYKQCLKVLDDYKSDERLKGLNAIVFLSLKKKGRGIEFDCVEQNEFNHLMDKVFENNIPVGMDSCTSLKFFNYLKERNMLDKYKDFIEPCESSTFSLYVNTEGKFYPCSFSEGEGEWKDGLDVVNCNDFIKDIWYNEKTIKFRNMLLNSCKGNCFNCRHCPLFKI